jgi:alpha-tubulin suppressor-like RCC1 family protein
MNKTAFAPATALGFIVLVAVLCGGSASRAQDGTMVELQNPTNSSPRVVSVWGGAGSEQIILKSDGTVWDWGYNLHGQLGNGTIGVNTDLPGRVLGQGGVGYVDSITAIIGGESHNMALKSDGTVWCWGWNYFGQLGDGSTNWGYTTSVSTSAVKVSGLSSVAFLGGRGYHNLAVKTDGTIWAWGDNQSGQLGNGLTNVLGTNTPVQVVGLTNPAAISGGGFYSLALMSNGTLWSWGNNTYGQLGDGTTNNSSKPVPVVGLSNVVAISCGWIQALAVKSDGTAWTWGDNSLGELGDGTTNNSSIPVQVLGLSNIVSVSGGDLSSLARRSDGTIWKWGRNAFGELGIGSFDSNAHPVAVQVPGLSNIVISAARDYHNICVKPDGTVWVWGDNRFGGCGDFTGNNVPSPRLMPGLVTNNIIPYAESFESYPGGTTIVGANFWSAPNPANAVVVATNYSYNGLYPVPGPHQSALSINGTVTNQFCPSFYSNLWVDTILQANPPTNPLPALTNCSFAIAVAPDGHFAVWNCTNPPAAGNGWTELQDTPIATNQFCRVTIEPNYTPDANGIFHYSVWVNGIPSTNPAARYAAADSSQPWFGQIVASGNFILDDLVVGTNKSFYALQTSMSAYGGSVSPSGPLIVIPSSTNTFLIAPSNWYTLASVTIDGTNAGTPSSCTFANVQSDHTVVANYVPILASNNTPEWWLYQQNPNWVTNFNAAALSDPTGKGVPVWQDYVAGTDPANPASLFALAMARTNGHATVSFPGIAATAQYQMQRYYALDCTTNLADPSSWQAVPGWTKVQGLGQNLTYSNTAGNPNLFFRGRVWLGP